MYSRSSEALWYDDERNVIYCFDGDNPEVERFAPPPIDSIQGFTPDGNGSGSGQWVEVLGFVGKKPFPSDIHGTSSGMFTSDEENAYYAGGFISIFTSPSNRSRSQQVNHGLLRLNFETTTFTNSSSLALSFYRGVMLNVPVFGTKGVLVAFGGSDDRSDDQSVELAAGFDVINIFDKEKQKWYRQYAEGDIPRPRILFCAVGVHGKEGTSFEM